MLAQQKLDSNDAEVQKISDHLKELSSVSKSEARTDLLFDDGSMLALMSREGGDVEARVIDPQTAAETEAVAPPPPK